jgi:3-dehydroquinate synthase
VKSNNILFIRNLDQTLTQFFEGYSTVAVLLDQNTETYCYPLVNSILPEHIKITVPPGEQHKGLPACELIWNELSNRNFDRNSVLVNLGGGVIGDLGGFAASIYKRGIKFINIPTTLLAQVDASIGGKTGVDFNGFKNQLGVFNEPETVIIHPGFLKTLSEREFISGFAEAVKHHLIADKPGWHQLMKKKPRELNIEEIINHSIKIKKTIVDQDPKESGVRKGLNFGHTIGHAIETHFLNSGNPVLHGEAISAGMACESFISYHENLLGENELNEITGYLRTNFPKLRLDMPVPELIRLMKQDKKNKNGVIKGIALDGIGNFQFDVTYSEKMIEESLAFYKRQMQADK